MGRKFYNSIKSQDMYGQPISLNYEGEDSFKTLPGGILSLTLTILIVFYGILKFKFMLNIETWSLVQQTLVCTADELSVSRDLESEQYSNLSVSLQFKIAKTKQTNEA
tara:strand:+ start:233 stop:556 length:324 start_codon:yes stop_codon:yes gene_type:complete